MGSDTSEEGNGENKNRESSKERREGMSAVFDILSTMQETQVEIKIAQATTTESLNNNNKLTEQVHAIVTDLSPRVATVEERLITNMREINKLRRYKRQDRAVSAGTGLIGGYLAILTTKIPWLSKLIGGP